MILTVQDLIDRLETLDHAAIVVAEEQPDYPLLADIESVDKVANQDGVNEVRVILGRVNGYA